MLPTRVRTRLGRLAVILPLSLLTMSAAQKPLSASAAWIRLPAEGATTTVAFAVIDNPTMYDVYLTGASTDVAAEVQLRQTPPGDGAATPLQDVPVAAYGKLELTPKGVHLVLSGLTRSLKAGDTIPLTFSTDAGAISTTAVVK